MKISFGAVLLGFLLSILSLGTVHAQDAPAPLLLATTPKPAPSKPPEKTASRFWTPVTSGLVLTDGAAKAVDAYYTRYNIDRGGTEQDPLMRPFVHSPALQAGAVATLFTAEILTAYVLHRKGHRWLSRAILAGGIALNGTGAQESIRHQ